jgi:hypothetical protein
MPVRGIIQTLQQVSPRANSVFFGVPTLGHRRASGTGQSLDVKTIQNSERQTHRHTVRLAERGFGFTDDHDRVPVEWFRYPDESEGEFTEDGINDMPLFTKGGELRQKRTNGAAINRSVFPVDSPDAAARFVQFLIDQKYAPAATAALFITVGIERRFNYRVAADVGVTNRKLFYWLRKARRAMTAETVPVPPIDLPDEQEPKHNPRTTDYWRKTKNRKVGGEIRDAVKATMRKMLEAEPDLSDSTLARKLTERAKVAISRRTVAKYRMALGIRRQGTLTEAIAEAMTQNPKVTDGEIAAMLTASTGKPVSFKTVAWNRLRLGLRKNRERRKPGQTRRPASPAARRKISEAMKHRWAEQKARQIA